ncbi:MAG: GNAT family N-acetyltransferase [Gemmataceae bacterium]
MPATPIVLVELTSEHLPAVRALWQASEGLTLRDADSPEALARYLARNPRLSVAAFAGGELVAAALCGHDGRRGYLHHVSVHPAHRRRGIGRRLVCLPRPPCRRGDRQVPPVRAPTTRRAGVLAAARLAEPRRCRDLLDHAARA